MKILMLAPHPFYQERGTPIACKLLCEALHKSGHQVDLLTFHLGENVSMPGVRIFRTIHVPGITRVSIGFSLAKLLCDGFLALQAIWMLCRGNYDAVHANEESVYIGLIAKLLIGIPVVYDMDSSMADQLIEKWPKLNRIAPLLQSLEQLAFLHSDAILVVCKSLEAKAKQSQTQAMIHVIEDIALPSPKDPPNVDDLRQYADNDVPLLLYVGNLETYQGIDLLLHAVQKIPDKQRCMLILIGGTTESIHYYTTLSDQIGIAHRVRFLGPRPIEHLNAYLEQADILISPRIKGTNTPMKLYSYLASGIPVIATRILSHTQAVGENQAYLVNPSSDDLAQGIIRLLNNAPLAKSISEHASLLVEQQYSLRAYREKVKAFAHAFRLSKLAHHGKRTPLLSI